ncbi:hypothetical protein OHB12_19865 [Nocardia sp. NBC_01730]|uniref:hypothetical protein n=1 Tax=Nocardia sp. NBC_01730 TaxID=2975998 RepID=UPI002E13B053|nr:hypothetical protein OHB12_19865 [Nocardia sp. NBC_01730]
MVNHTFQLPHTVPHSTDLVVLTVNPVATGLVGVSCRRVLRAPRRTRLLGVLALLAGIVAMHSAVFAISGHAHATTGHGTVAVRFDDAFSARTQRGHNGVQPGQDRPQPRGDGDSSGSMVVQDHIHNAQSAPRTRHATGQSAIPAPPPAPPTRPVDAAVLATGGAAPDPDCAGKECGGTHGGMHGCVFILAAGAVLFALVLLCRMAVDRPGSGVALPRHWRPRRSRPPPWTVPTLAELAILRI